VREAKIEEEYLDEGPILFLVGGGDEMDLYFL
jgi:hypothetical protein